MRVLEQLHSSRKTGSMTRPVASWAMIIGCSEEKAEEFINYIDKYDLAEVEYDEDVTITCRRMKKARLEKEKSAERQRVYRAKPKKVVKKTKPTVIPSEERRANMLTELRKIYHPNRAGLQPTYQKTELNKIMIEASRQEAPANKGKVELKLFDKIKEYVSALKNTESWDTEGRYIPGLGNFLKSRAWEFGVPTEDVKKIKSAATNNLWGKR